MATQSQGVYRKNSDGSWTDYNSNNQIYVRNSGNSGWNDGSYYPDGVIYRRNSSNNGWEQIYPLGVIEVTNPSITVSGSSTMDTKQKSYSSWRNKSTSYHGWCTISGAGGEQFGVIGASYTQFTGAGAITSVGTAYFSGTSGAAGNYNAAQKLTVRGCNFSGSIGSGDPFGSHDSSGYMIYTWQGTGANSTIPEGAFTVYNNGLLRWMNNTSGYGKYLCMYNGETSSDTSYSASSQYSNNYLGVTKFVMRIGSYTYEASAQSLSRPESQAKLFSMSNSDVPKDDNYLNLVLPANYDYNSTEELIEKIENGEIDYVTPDKMITFASFDYKPVIYQIEDNIVFTSPIFDANIKVQYEYNGEWITSLNTNPRHYLIREGSAKVRLINIVTEELFYECNL